ncbi:DUF192 domain-containing protein [Alishewanella sp. SMS8]|uniref:DUF192 domain-containing protein n=1 Tax=Alishewanella sp. SMS8 TaxID=2994676 RepID=UPI002741A129|nr:DUF192 domain-containing protein [Alishewanella sp. SMS8]MDP5207057.1 DUF192 domain-containing protein [Alishewanella sp. SMS9]MDP5458790.1 DUF192 domain-containing protein [Alishewanella sp. SMS8]
MKAWLLSFCLLLTSCAATTQTTLLTFPAARLQLDSVTVPVQLANTPTLRAQGLMFQQQAEPGMLLLYTEPQAISLWMRNTSMPLDVAFITEDWTIHHIRQLQPFDETPVPSEIAIIAALEMPQGWFAAQNLGKGTPVRLLAAEAKP